MRAGLIALIAPAVVSAGATAAVARDGTRAPATGHAHTQSQVIPNPYAPAAPSRDRAGDAYATGFAIGLGTALMQKQAEDERRRRAEDLQRKR